MESNSQPNQWNQIKVLPAKMTLKRKAASLEQTLSALFMCVLRDQVIAFGTSPRIPKVACIVKASISLPRVGEVPHLPGVPHIHVTRPLVSFYCFPLKRDRERLRNF